MPLDEGQINHSGIKAFKDPKGFDAFTDPAPTEKAFNIPAVALTDQRGQHVGTSDASLSVSLGDLMQRVLTQLQINNLHLAEITGQDFKEEDV